MDICLREFYMWSRLKEPKFVCPHVNTNLQRHRQGYIQAQMKPNDMQVPQNEESGLLFYKFFE